METASDVEREPEIFEDGLTWAVVYLVPEDAATTSNIDGPMIASGNNSSLTGSLTDTPHAPPADEFEDMGIRFFVFRDLGRSIVSNCRFNV